MKIAIWSRTIAIVSLWLGAANAHAQSVLASPNGQVEIRFGVEANQATYEVHFNGRRVIAPSALGLDCAADPWSSSKRLAKRAQASTNATALSWAKLAKHATPTMRPFFPLRETGQRARRLDVVFRAYDDGAAFATSCRSNPTSPASRSRASARGSTPPTTMRAGPTMPEGWKRPRG